MLLQNEKNIVKNFSSCYWIEKLCTNNESHQQSVYELREIYWINKEVGSHISVYLKFVYLFTEVWVCLSTISVFLFLEDGVYPNICVVPLVCVYAENLLCSSLEAGIINVFCCVKSAGSVGS